MKNQRPLQTLALAAALCLPLPVTTSSASELAFPVIDVGAPEPAPPAPAPQPKTETATEAKPAPVPAPIPAPVPAPKPKAEAKTEANTEPKAQAKPTAPAKAAAQPSLAPACAVVPETYHGLAPDKVLQVQNALAYFGLYGNRFDAIFGPDTRAGLAKYCSMHDLSIGTTAAARQAILDELVRDSTIDRVYHGWRGILASPGFAPWTATQKDADTIRVLVKTGTAAQIIDIIDRYLKYRPEAPKTRSTWEDGYGISYSLVGDDYTALAARRGIVDKLAKLKGDGFMERADLTASIAELLGNGPEAKTAMELIEQYADKLTVVTLGQQGIARLKAARVPDQVIELLGELEDPGYPSREEANKAIRTLLTEGSKAGTKATDKAPLLNAAAIDAPSAKAGAKETKPADAPTQWGPLIVSQLEESTAYRISNDTWAKLSKAVGAVPAYVPALLAGVRDVDYPLRRLFSTAAQIRIKGALAGFRDKACNEIAQRHLKQLDDALFAKLKKENLPDELLAQFKPLQEKEFESEEALKDKVGKFFDDEIKRVPEYTDLLADQARKQHLPDSAKPPLLSATADCKCLPNTMEHMVYGFYPFWLGGQARSVDFSRVSRIGYYALGIDDDGSLLLPSADAAEYFGESFITMRRYRTDVDYVVAKNDWSAWAALPHDKRAIAFETLTADIVKLLDQNAKDPLSRLKPYITLGRHNASLADGVTLFFEHYPEEHEYADQFYLFLSDLRAKLTKRKKFVNIMLPSGALGQKGIFEYERLALLLKNDKNADDVPDRLRLLVMLDEPYTDTKKSLRQNVESHLKGASRRNLLRTIVPVIVPDGKSSITDDVIYMGDNFGGIGFWPPPAQSAEAPGNLLLPGGDVIKKEYYPATNYQEANPVCGIVCPNRWLFRLALDIFLIASLVCLATYVWCCECRDGLRRHFITVLACTAVPLIALFMALLGCDPSWFAMATGNVPLYLVLIAIVVYAIWEYWQRRQEIP